MRSLTLKFHANLFMNCFSPFVCFFAVLWLCGCGVSAPERLEFTSIGDTPRTFPTSEGNATYSLDLANTSFILSDLTSEQLQNPTGNSVELFGYVLHVELLWVPLAGKTAIDPEATNISIRLIVFSGHEVGLYGGGGFAWPKGEPGEEDYGVDIVGSNATLLAATNGFKDLLSPAQLTGRLRSTLNETQNKQMRRAASQIVTNALKRVQWVGPRAIEMQKRASSITSTSMDNAEFVLR